MNEDYWLGLWGGAFIGAAAVILWWFNGRILGVSGILSRLLQRPSPDFAWQAAFVSGLVLGGFILAKFVRGSIEVEASPLRLLIAGLLVGFGTVMGSGCTSGHGVCGIARFSKRSILATLIFMVTGMLTVWLARLLGGF